MELQKLFRRTYIQKLTEQIKNGEIIDFYRGDSFLFSPEMLLVAPNINKPDNLALINTDNSSKGPEDCENAKRLYNAYKNLTPLQASDERFWIYLAHADHFQYMTKRWPGIVKDESKDKPDYIFKHWFISSPTQSNLLRHGIAGLWWAAHLSFDENHNENPFHLTEILFKNIDFATRTLGAYKLARHKAAVKGILSYIKENPDLFETKFEDKSRYITKYMNQLGGTKPIPFLAEEYFQEALKGISTNISKI
jgi:hypothetical protein